jgi:microcompartment protein CcmK/EutM
MVIAKVSGTVVTTNNTIPIAGAKFLLLDVCNQMGEPKGSFIVALDLVGAGYNDLVMVSQSTPARETPVTANKPVDAVIVGIIDMIDEYNKVIYKK